MRKLIALGVLAACGGTSGGSTDIKGTMVIASHSDTDIARLLSAAGGTDMFSAQAQVESFSPPRTDPCPAVAIAGTTVTITGGCTTQDGVTIAGSATIDNPTTWDAIQYNYSKPTVYTFDQLSLTQSGFAQTYAGVTNIEGSFTTYDSDVTTTSMNQVVRADLYYHCSSTMSCSLSGSGIELGGEGVLASGSLSLQGQTTVAKYTLQGVDKLTATITNGCVAWKIEGTDRQTTCP